MASSSLSQPTAPPSSPSKRQKISLQEEAVVENDDVNRMSMSDLPDCLLCHILSFLPTKNAVATSILSSRWKTLWTFVPCLYLDLLYVRPFSSIPHIMSRVFAQHKAPYLRKFLLHAHLDSDAFDVDKWIRASVSPNLEELDLSIQYWDLEVVELPPYIFSSKNLIVLKVSGDIFLHLPSSFKLPSLKILHLSLSSLTLVDNDWKLLSGCPVLEDLVLERDTEHYDNVVEKLEICIPTLKRLRLQIKITGPKLEINAPALEYLNFTRDLGEVVFVEKLPNLVEANIDIAAFGRGDRVHLADKVLGLLRELYNVKFMWLSHGTIKCLGFAYDRYDLPMFHNLTGLNYEFCCRNWNLLLYLLDLAPNLEVLVLDNSPCPSYPHSPVCVKQPLNGSDLSPHLTNFYFRGFKGLKDELKFVRGIMKKARVLKKMAFICDSNYLNAEEKSHILKKVSNFPRHSMSCQIAFE